MPSARPAPARPTWSAARARLLFALKGARELVFDKNDGRHTFALGAVNNATRQIVWLRGSVQVETPTGTPLRLEPGSVWSPASGGKITLRNVLTSDATGIELIFAPGLAADYVTFIAEHFGRTVSLPHNADALRHARALTANDADELRYSQKIFRWLSSLHGTLEKRQMHLADLLRGPSNRLRDVCARHGHSVKALSAHLGCTPAFLAGRLRRAWQMPAGEGLRRLRHEHARELLTTTTLPVADVAWRCGFSTPAAFSTSFKQREGINPSRARTARAAPTPSITDTTKPTRAPTIPARRRSSKIWDETPVTVWTGPYFQLDGGEVDWPYATPYDLAINGITNAVHWVYTLEGEAVFEIGKTSITVKPGMLIVYPKPLNARWHTPTGKPWRRIWVNARGPWACNALTELAQTHGWAAKFPASSAPVKLARQWVRYWNEHRNEPSVAGSQAAYAWLLSWWRLLLRDGVTPVPLPDLSKLHSRSFFRRIKTITGYAKEIGYSRAHISRKLRSQWKGGTPAQIVRRQRLAQAALELRQTRLSVAEIALRAQFACAGSFIPAFKREFGVTPLTYRFSQS